jgi:hypothetical protein
MDHPEDHDPDDVDNNDAFVSVFVNEKQSICATISRAGFVSLRTYPATHGCLTKSVHGHAPSRHFRNHVYRDHYHEMHYRQRLIAFGGFARNDGLLLTGMTEDRCLCQWRVTKEMPDEQQQQQQQLQGRSSHGMVHDTMKAVTRHVETDDDWTNVHLLQRPALSVSRAQAPTPNKIDTNRNDRAIAMSSFATHLTPSYYKPLPQHAL